MGVLVDLLFTVPSADGVMVAAAFQSPDISSTITGLDPAAAQEKQNIITKFINKNGEEKVRIRKYIPMHQLLGITKLQFKANVESYASLANTGPALTPVLRIAAGSVTGAANLTVQCMVNIKYYTQWYERLQLSQS